MRQNYRKHKVLKWHSKGRIQEKTEIKGHMKKWRSRSYAKKKGFVTFYKNLVRDFSLEENCQCQREEQRAADLSQGNKSRSVQHKEVSSQSQNRLAHNKMYQQLPASEQTSVRDSGRATDEMNRWKDKANQESRYTVPARTISASVHFAVFISITRSSIFYPLNAVCSKRFWSEKDGSLRTQKIFWASMAKRYGWKYSCWKPFKGSAANTKLILATNKSELVA